MVYKCALTGYAAAALLQTIPHIRPVCKVRPHGEYGAAAYPAFHAEDVKIGKPIFISDVGNGRADYMRRVLVRSFQFLLRILSVCDIITSST